MIIIQAGSSFEPQFTCGALVFTPGVDALVRSKQINPFHYFGRHLCGDWGNICDEDRQANADALISGARLLSSYLIEPELKLWIITEADRSVTTLLLPEEY